MAHLIDKGITRIVLNCLFFAIKIANPFNGHLNFLQGCLSNYKERQFYKSFKNYKPICNMICPSYYCSYFGLVQVQKRCDVNTKELTNEELEYFKPVRNGESKPQNFGFIGDKIVCLDYA